MSRHRSDWSSKFVAYAAAIMLHIALLAAMVFNFSSKPEEIVGFEADKIDTIVASAVSESAVQEQLEQIKEQDRLRELERQYMRALLSAMPRSQAPKFLPLSNFARSWKAVR